MVIEPGSYHRTTRVHGRASFSVVQVEPAVLARIAGQVSLGGPPPVRVSSTTDQRLALALARLVESTAAGDDESEIESHLYEYVRCLWAGSGDFQAPPESSRILDGRVRRTRRWVRELYIAHDPPEKPPSLARMADEAGLSPPHFSHAFTRWVGVSPYAYLNGCRLVGARRLLEQGIPATEVAALLGFSDLPALSRHFRKRYGLSPRQWQQRASRNRR
jgi:AraC-like DNA-binding protein